MRHDHSPARPSLHKSEATSRRGSGLARAIRGALGHYRAWRRRRIAVRHLGDLDDYLLRDIGITRSEILRATRRGALPRHD